MKKTALLIALACAGSLYAQDPEKPQPSKPNSPPKKEANQTKVTWLGVATDEVNPIVLKQLGLKHGLTISHVMKESPAEKGGLETHDILTKFDDQHVVTHRQLSALVRAHKAGDTVKLSVLREGKEETLDIKLDEHVQKHPQPHHRLGMNPNPRDQRWGIIGDPQIRGFGRGFENQMGDLRGLDKRLQDQIQRALREAEILKRDPANLGRFGNIQSKVITNANSTMVLSDNEGTITITEKGGKKHLKATDKEGNVQFDGPISTDKEYEKVPKNIQDRVKVLKGNIKIDVKAGGVKLQKKRRNLNSDSPTA